MDRAKRSQILIEPYKQLRFGLIFLLINLIFSLSIILVFGYFLWDMYQAISIYFKLDADQSMVTAEKFAVPLGFGMGLITLFIFTTLFFSARYTHQIYGPMVSIRRFLDDLIAGRAPTPIKLRKTDQLQDLADRLNSIAGQLNFTGVNESRATILDFLDQTLEGRETSMLDLDADDPLKEISVKITQLAKLKKT